MCGIAGIAGLEGTTDPEGSVARMVAAMAHRGPDAGGVKRFGRVVLGHRRLSIIDLSPEANQPFLSADGRSAIIFNGEIYNYRALRSELEREMGGASFRTGSDTEVLLAAYARWGPKCLDKLHGMFAFALYDGRTDELFLARDRIGIKPLYYHASNGRAVFASELRALLASGCVPRKADPAGIVDHLRYATVHGPHTLVQDVRMLPPGHWMRIGSGGDIRIERWWAPTTHALREAAELPEGEVHAQVRGRLRAAVEKRLVSDVPIGAFLSGGIDSSAVVGLMAEVSDAPVHTFSVVFDEEEFSEERFAAIVAKRFNTRHEVLRLRATDMLHAVPDVLAAMDHPSGDGPNTWLVSRATKKAGITVALSGLGGDELFAGYPVFTRLQGIHRWRWTSLAPQVLRRAAMSALVRMKPALAGTDWPRTLVSGRLEVEDLYAASRLLAPDEMLSGLLRDGGLPASTTVSTIQRLMRDDGGAALPFLSRVSIAELATYLPDVLLRDTDQMSMAHALEVRVPFLDHDLVEFVLGVSDGLKYPHSPKQLLIGALNDLLPAEVVHRPKMGFTLPWAKWMHGELASFCGERIASLGQRDVFRPGRLEALWKAFRDGDPRVGWFRLWPMVVLEDWLERNGVST